MIYAFSSYSFFCLKAHIHVFCSKQLIIFISVVRLEVASFHARRKSKTHFGNLSPVLPNIELMLCRRILIIFQVAT